MNKKSINSNLLYIEIGKRIKKERLMLNLTQEKFSELLGISPNHLGDVERGIKTLSLSKLHKFSKDFNLSLDYLITGVCSSPCSETVMEDSDYSEQITSINHLLSACSPEDLDLILAMLQPLVYRLRK